MALQLTVAANANVEERVATWQVLDQSLRPEQPHEYYTCCFTLEPSPRVGEH
eukprot:m.39920 g.39920  ORF g.39920 m.39920 type:complete len:52 (-) comp12714_c0_seq3:6-161(-)